mmetsp:Transcript_23144/g.74125  ORF Transcript_23144/g.74125 Transcript_23144/m.74125 type:complete len:322 (-) Transcript_23144:197-1162(-)
MGSFVESLDARLAREQHESLDATLLLAREQCDSLDPDAVSYVDALLLAQQQRSSLPPLLDNCSSLPPLLDQASAKWLHHRESFAPALSDISEQKCKRWALEVERQEVKRLRWSIDAFGTGFGLAEASTLTMLMDCGLTNGLSHIRLGGCYLGDDGLRPIVASLARVPRLRTLGLAHNGLGDCSIQALAEALSASPGRVLPALQRLWLFGNDISDEGVISLTKLFEAGELPRLAKLGLGANRIGDAGVQALARCGRTALGAVDTLGLRENPRISTAGVDALAAALESGAFASLKTLWLPAAHEWHGGIAAACREREVTLICA